MRAELASILGQNAGQDQELNHWKRKLKEVRVRGSRILRILALLGLKTDCLQVKQNGLADDHQEPFVLFCALFLHAVKLMTHVMRPKVQWHTILPVSVRHVIGRIIAAPHI